MSRIVHRVLSRVFAVVLVVVGIAAVIGGSWAHNYVSDQLSQERITMPSGDSLTTSGMKDALGKWSGQRMSTGPQAEAFANDYILEHMNKASQGRTYEEVSGEFMAKCTKSQSAAATDECATLGQLRQTLFMGDSLRGMLLTAYAWWTVGTIALWAGWICIGLGVVLAVLGWFVLRGDGTASRPVEGQPAHAAPENAS